MILCFYIFMFLKIKKSFLKSSRPSLPLKKAPPFSPSLSSIVFTPPSVPPVLGDRNPQGREDVTALRCSEPLRYKVGGPSKVYAMVIRDRTAWMQCILYLILSLICMNQQKEKTSYYCLLINFAANSKKSATFLKLSYCWQYITA